MPLNDFVAIESHSRMIYISYGKVNIKSSAEGKAVRHWLSGGATICFLPVYDVNGLDPFKGSLRSAHNLICIFLKCVTREIDFFFPTFLF